MTSRSLGHRAPLLWLVVPFIGGIATGRYGPAARPAWLLALALAAAGLSGLAAWRAPRWWCLPIALTLLLAGNASYTLRRARLAAWEQLPAREVRLSLRVDRVFPQDEARKAAGLATVVRSETHLPDLASQRIYFSLKLDPRAVAPVRSMIIATVGVLAPLPENPSPTTFDGYLADAGMNFRLARGRVLAVEQPPTRYRMFCEHLGHRLNAILSAGVAAKRPELAAVYRAMMLGQKYELNLEQEQLFMHSGTMHLFRCMRLPPFGRITTKTQTSDSRLSVTTPPHQDRQEARSGLKMSR